MNNFYHFSTMTISSRVQSGMFFFLFETKLTLFKPEQDRKSHESRPDRFSAVNRIGDLYQSRKQKKNLTQMGKLDKCDALIDPVSE